MGVASRNGKQRRGDAGADQGSAIAAEAGIDGALYGNLVRLGNIEEPTDDAAVVMRPGVFVDQRRTVAKLHRHFFLTGAGIIGDGAVVDGDRQIERSSLPQRERAN